MTVAELIEELQKLPAHAAVRMVADFSETDEDTLYFSADVGAVVWEGNHVALQP